MKGSEGKSGHSSVLHCSSKGWEGYHSAVGKMRILLRQAPKKYRMLGGERYSMFVMQHQRRKMGVGSMFAVRRWL